MDASNNFTPGFCPNCGSILPPLKSAGGVTCFLCSKDYDASGRLEIQYINFRPF